MIAFYTAKDFPPICLQKNSDFYLESFVYPILKLSDVITIIKILLAYNAEEVDLAVQRNNNTFVRNTGYQHIRFTTDAMVEDAVCCVQ